MKKLFILSGVALMVSSALTMAADGKSKRDFESFDVNADGVITLAEAGSRMAKHFDRIDSDGDGSVNKAEFEAMKAMHKGKGHKKAAFADFDSNGDGDITAAEFDAMKKMHKGNRKLNFVQVDANSDGVVTKDEAKGRLLKGFDKIDSDANGSITTTEFAAMENMHKGKGHKKGNGNHKLDFAQVDTNNDAKITKDEAKGRLLKHFDKIDSDANGSITTTEFTAMENMHKGKGHKKGNGNHKLDFAQVDTNNDAKITKDEAKGGFLKYFDKIDADADGAITSAEFDAMKAMHKGKGKGHKQPTFAKVDTNNDGKITKNEAKGRLLKGFDKIDTDADGAITSAEFELVKKMGKGKRDQKLTFTMVDANNDGSIAKSEAKGRLLKHFDRIDADNNGQLSEQEFNAMVKAKKSHKRPTFEMLDTDGNGKVSQVEFDSFHQQHAKMNKQA